MVNADDYFITDRNQRKRRRAKCSEFAKRLSELRKGCDGLFLAPMPEVREKFIEYKYKNEMKIWKLEKENSSAGSLEATYYSRLPLFVLKLSALSCISRNEKALTTRRLPELMIRGNDLNWAISKVKQHVDDFEKILMKWKTKSKSRTPETNEKYTELLLNHIKLRWKQNQLGMTVKELHSYTGWSKPSIKAKLDEMVEDGFLNCTKGKGSSKGGKKPNVYSPPISQSVS